MTFEASFGAAAQATAMLPREAGAYRALTDAALVSANALCADLERDIAAVRALIAGELAHRSRPELGNDGLAQRAGFRTPEQFVAITTGASKREAVRAVKVGTLLVDLADDGRIDPVTGEIQQAGEPWMRPAALAIAAGTMSVESAQAIRIALGAPDSVVSSEDLQAAVASLVAAAADGVGPDDLARHARDLRDSLDVSGVALREEERRQKRSFTLVSRPDGTGRVMWELDPESHTLVRQVIDRMVSPKLGGVRFVDPAAAALAEQIAADERTPAQIASDGMLQLLVAGADADVTRMLGSGAPSVNITVTADALQGADGLGRIEGVATPVSIATTNRLICSGITVPMVFDGNGNSVDVGRANRLFSPRQKAVLAVKFGGCMDPYCDRPPSWCESHHVRQVARDAGETTVGNGILLCRWHHLKYHNEGYEISVDERGDYWLHPPKSRDPLQRPVRMPLKVHNLRDLNRRAAV